MIKNLTPHPIVVRQTFKDATEKVFAPSGIVPRVTVTQTPCGAVEGIEVVSTVYGAVEGLPEMVEGITLIVSGIVLAALAGSRADCVGPDTSPASAIRDGSGQIVAVRRFTR
jgi:hypothetical protein